MNSTLPTRLKEFAKELMPMLLPNPLRAVNFLGITIAYKLRLKKVPALPVEIDIEPSNTCNFKCGHCQVTYWDKKPAALTLDTFIQILDRIPHAARVKLQGMGEPLLNKNLIPMLQAGEKRGLQMFFHTNGSIGDPEKAAQLVQLKNTHIIYSVDGATAETFERVRPGSRFERIVENILTLTKLRDIKSKLLVSAWTVITQNNVQELAQIVRLAKQLGLTQIVIQPQLTNWGKDKMLVHTDEIQVETESDLFTTQLAEAQAIATAEGINLAVNQSNRFTRQSPCACAWNSTYIAANGDVVPCSVIADADIVKMGNVFETDFKEIWNSPAYQSLREQITNHDLPEYCKHCYLDAEPIGDK
jgi:radical SAM protein with 4Fe4S-binding SPASM domain